MGGRLGVVCGSLQGCGLVGVGMDVDVDVDVDVCRRRYVEVCMRER